MCEKSSCKIEKKKHCDVVVNCNNIVIVCSSSNKGILNSFYNNTNVTNQRGEPVFENAGIIYLDVGILLNYRRVESEVSTIEFSFGSNLCKYSFQT